jgi:hypothetical protein
MPETYELYRDAMGDTWKGWWVTWPLSHQVLLGGVYDVQDGAMRTAGSMAKRGITFEPIPGTRPGAFTYDSHGAVTVRFKAAGNSPDGFSALAAADVGALVEFQRTNAVLVVYQGLSQLGMEDVKRLAGELVPLWWNGSWTESMVAVTEVVSAAGGRVLSSRGTGAAAELKLSATAGAGGPVGLVDLAVGGDVKRSVALGLEWAGGGVTPFYQVVQLRKDWRGRVKVRYGPRQTGRGAQPSEVPTVLVEEARDDPDSVIEVVPMDGQAPIEAGDDGPDETQETR